MKASRFGNQKHLKDYYLYDEMPSIFLISYQVCTRYVGHQVRLIHFCKLQISLWSSILIFTFVNPKTRSH